MSKLRVSTRFCALAMERLTIGCSIGSPSGILSFCMMTPRRSPPKMRSSGSSSDREKRELPGAPRGPETPTQRLVYPPRFVALGADDVRAAGLDHRVVADLPVALQLVELQVL